MSADAADTGGGDDGTVVFDVGGRRFKVLRQTVQAQPSTLLATLLDDVSIDSSKPIFVDANPDRFNHILDWYRYREMFVPSYCPVDAVLRDARFFLLPDVIRVNGISYALRPPFVEETRDALVRVVTSYWPNFEKYIQDLISDVKAHFVELGERAAQPHADAMGHADARQVDKHMLSDDAFPPKEIVLSTTPAQGLFGPWNRWTDPENVCNKERLWVLIAELEKRGFACDFAPGDRVVLRVGLRLGEQIAGSRTQRIQINGVDAVKGRLPVIGQNE